MKKKILFVIDSLHSGGAEKSLISLLSVLDYSRFCVDLLLFNKKGLYLSLIPKEINILKVPKYFDYRKERKFDFKIKLSKITNSILIRNPYYKKKYHGAQITCKNILKCLESLSVRYDVAIAYSQGLPTYFVSEKVLANKKLCWVNTDYKKARYNSRFDKKYYEKYNYIIAVSEKNKDILEEVYPEFKHKIKIIYDIIPTKLILKSANGGNGYNDKFDGIRILTIGRHVYLKGYDIAIDAAKILKEKEINFRWYSIGEGVLTEDLKKKIKANNLEDRFIFLGTYTNPYPFIKECDIYCQPSRFEGFGMAIAEAKILNKPIVATDFKTVHDQIENGVNGLITKMDGYSLYSALNELIENYKLREKIMKNIKNENNRSEDEIYKVYELIESMEK